VPSQELINSVYASQRIANSGLGFVGQTTRTTNQTFAATETVIITSPSVTFYTGRAYKVTVWGLHSAGTDSYALYRIRKGNTNTGTVYKDTIRVNNAQASGAAVAVNFSTILTNITGANITTAISLLGLQGAVAQTWTWTADAADVSYLLIEDCGSTALYSGQPIS
jgi:hypothetical protein